MDPITDMPQETAVLPDNEIDTLLAEATGQLDHAEAASRAAGQSTESAKQTDNADSGLIGMDPAELEAMLRETTLESDEADSHSNESHRSQPEAERPASPEATTEAEAPAPEAAVTEPESSPPTAEAPVDTQSETTPPEAPIEESPTGQSSPASLITKTTKPEEAPETESVSVPVKRSFLKKLLASGPWLLAMIIVLADMPFFWLPAKIKSLLGCVAIATLLIAVATWAYALRHAP